MKLTVAQTASGRSLDELRLRDRIMPGLLLYSEEEIGFGSFVRISQPHLHGRYPESQ
jgi:hypothetical protein